MIRLNPSFFTCVRGESGWCSDVTSTHGAWRHAGVRVPLPELPGITKHHQTEREHEKTGNICDRGVKNITKQSVLMHYSVTENYKREA